MASRASTPPAGRSCAPRAPIRQRRGELRALRRLARAPWACGISSASAATIRRTARRKIAERCAGRIGVATVPKTIDNDLPLPDNAPTFGSKPRARSARESSKASWRTRADRALVRRHQHGPQVGFASARHVQGGRRDAGGDSRGVSAECATLSSVVERSSARSSSGAPWAGVTASPSSPKGSPNGSGRSFATPRAASCATPTDNVRLADVPLGTVLRDAVRKRLDEIGGQTTVRQQRHRLRAALRASPVPFDRRLHPTLGFGAVRYILRAAAAR